MSGLPRGLVVLDLGGTLHTGNRTPRDRSLLVLDVDWQIVALQHGSGDLDDLCQFGRVEPMVFVVGNPALSGSIQCIFASGWAASTRIASRHSAAIDS